jgi:hypothetical protein
LVNDVLQRFADYLRQPDLGPLRARAEIIAARWLRARPGSPVVQSFAASSIH